MKCPKCGYLGFETGDRCKNCGYDFSLLAAPAPTLPDPDLTIRTDDAETGAPELWLDRLDRSMDEASKPGANQEHLIGVPEGPPPDLDTEVKKGLPLFNPDDPDDIPLIALPTAPRPPLAVRRPAEASRLRAVPRAPRASTPAPALDFHEENLAEEPAAERLTRETSAPAVVPATRLWAGGAGAVGGRRLAALLIDHVLLAAIDAAVVYFTMRMAGLTFAEGRMLPLVPMVTFIALVKLSYFIAFTAIGGQTIGKMAMGIRVVGERGTIGCACAIRRTLASLLTLLTAGLGFLPAFFGADRRTLHDRLTGTRVVGSEHLRLGDS